ncbi:MAG: helix-turn-helix domain-containing protein [Acetobacter sp.]|nr:helix-turn-helix domain-containing protein [Acetobacter sp.]
MGKGKRLRESDRNQIRQLLAHGRTYKEIRTITGFSLSTIARCRTGVVQLADGSEVRTMSPPKPRKPENKLLHALPDKPIQKTVTKRSKFINGVLVDVDDIPQEAEQVLTKVDDVFNFLLQMDPTEFRIFIRNVRKARFANKNYMAKLEKLEALKNTALSIKNPAK